MPDPMKLLLIEDDDREISVFKTTLTRYEHEKSKKINLVEAKSHEGAMKVLDNSFDGVLIDLKLGADDSAGNRITKTILDIYRIPIIILTGTPDNIDQDSKLYTVYKKGEVGYDEIFDKFYSIFDTGLTRILGGRGIIEDKMNKTFWTNIIPQLNSWVTYSQENKNTEHAILRLTVNHLFEILDNDSIDFLAEEMYIYPPNSDTVKTGNILKKKNSEDAYIILSPACDLVIHSGSIKTSHILVCEIENLQSGFIRDKTNDYLSEIPDTANIEEKDKKEKSKQQAYQILNRLVSNNYSSYYHYLPCTKYFVGGLINFRKISTYKKKELLSNFSKPHIQVSSVFVKDIISRFASYYGRQGQPSFDVEDLFSELIKANH